MNPFFFVRPLAFACLLGLTVLPSRAANLIVSNLNDSGKGSLRQVVANANATSAADTIKFASSLKGTITLTTGELTIRSDMNLVGPDAGALTLNGGRKSRLLTIAKGTVSLSGLTFAQGIVQGRKGDYGGQTGEDASGGAIVNQGRLTIMDSSFESNVAQGGEGGVGASSGGMGPSNGHPGSGGRGGTARGGAIYNNGMLKIVRTKFKNNTAQGGNGGPGGSTMDKAPFGSGGAGGDAYGGAVYGLSSPGERCPFFGNRAIGGSGRDGSSNNVFDPVPQAQNGSFSGALDVPFYEKLPATGDTLTTYFLVSGELPPGLSLNSQTGVITGTPSETVENQRVTFKVSNQFGESNVATVTFTIKFQIVLDVASSTVFEGNKGTTAMAFILTLSPASTQSVSVDVQTLQNTALADQDYQSLGKTRITFAPGQTTRTVTVNVKGDTRIERNERFFLQLSNPTNAALRTNTVTGTIFNDDGSDKDFELPGSAAST